jgi:hypothetical protein
LEISHDIHRYGITVGSHWVNHQNVVFSPTYQFPTVAPLGTLPWESALEGIPEGDSVEETRSARSAKQFQKVNEPIVTTTDLSHRTHTMSTTGTSSDDKAARRKRFEDVFPLIADELLGYIKGEGMPKDAVEWYEKVSCVLNAFLAYARPSGKLCICEVKADTIS